MTDITVSVGAWCKNLEICGSSSITCFSAVFPPFLINMTWNKKQKRPWSKHRLHVSCVVLTKQLSQTLTNPYQHLPYLPAIEALSTSLHFLFSFLPPSWQTGLSKNTELFSGKQKPTLSQRYWWVPLCTLFTVVLPLQILAEGRLHRKRKHWMQRNAWYLMTLNLNWFVKRLR